MIEPTSHRNEPAPATRREIKWDAVAAIIASLVGFLALLVAGYTAYIARYTANVQLKQVQAQVWPWLVAGNNDSTQSLDVYNKGVGPAIVRSAQVFIDGKPQTDWAHVLVALGMPPHHYTQSTLNPNVLSPGEVVPIIRFPGSDEWQQFRTAAVDRMTMKVCFCSSLGECWMYADQHPVGYKSIAQLVRPIAQCPRLPQAEIFNN